MFFGFICHTVNTVFSIPLFSTDLTTFSRDLVFEDSVLTNCNSPEGMICQSTKLSTLSLWINFQACSTFVKCGIFFKKADILKWTIKFPRKSSILYWLKQNKTKQKQMRYDTRPIKAQGKEKDRTLTFTDSKYFISLLYV